MKIKKVIFSDLDLRQKFNELSDKDPIKKALVRAIEDLKESPFAGRIVKKKLIPKKFRVYDNLMIYNLPRAWRMLYTIKAKDELEIFSIILDWMDHKDYENIFGF